MIDGVFTQDIKPLDEYMPYAPYPMYPSGLKDSDKAIFRYAHSSSNHPNLIIVDPIYDQLKNVIMPGYYELVLSDDRIFLLLLQSDKIIAIIPVFKYEEDKKAVEKLHDKKYLKEQAKEQKKQAKIDAKRAKQGIPPEEKLPYMKASIEYDKDGGYYLVKYERDRIRAWGAIKK